MKYYYIKDDMGYYFHKNKRRWFKDRESVIPYTSKEKIYKYLSNRDVALWTVWKSCSWKVVEIEVSEEKEVFNLNKENFGGL